MPHPNQHHSCALHVQVAGNRFVDPATAAEIVSLTLFDLDAQAIGEDVVEGAPILVAGFATVAAAEAARTALIERHETLVVSATTEPVLAAEWVETQRLGLEPSTIGPWHIRAPWDPTPSDIDPRYDIVIDPGAAFGHGAHPTTQLAIELMLRHLPEDARSTRVVDVGTGTGVAAIIAARSGASVYAIENDEAAVEVARRNIERNSVQPHDDTTDRIHLIHGDAADAEIAADDLVVANVTLDVHRMVAATCASANRLVLSGILCRQVRDLQHLYAGHMASTIHTTGEWAGAEFSSAAPGCRKRSNE